MATAPRRGYLVTSRVTIRLFILRSRPSRIDAALVGYADADGK